MTKNKLVSVIMPVYNAEKLLGSSVETVLSQNYNDLELILVDDGSSDQSPRICDQFSQQDERVKVIHQANAGVSAARNAGLDKASGDYICFIDSDDLLDVDFLTKMLAVLEDQSVDIACSSRISFVDEADFSTIERENINRQDFSASAAIDNFLYQKEIANAVWSKLYRRQLFDDVRFPLGVAMAEDVLTNYLVFKKAQKISLLANYQGYGYRQDQPGSLVGAKFSPKRMAGLDMTQQILDDCLERQANVRAAKDRHFREAASALFSLLQLPKDQLVKYKIHLEKLKTTLKQHSFSVVTDKNTTFIARQLALIAFISPNLLISAIKINRFLKGVK